MERKGKDGEKIADLSDMKIDYSKVDELLVQFRASSVEYLRSIIEA